jgi:hypothetical protein
MAVTYLLADLSHVAGRQHGNVGGKLTAAHDFFVPARAQSVLVLALSSFRLFAVLLVFLPHLSWSYSEP